MKRFLSNRKLSGAAAPLAALLAALLLLAPAARAQTAWPDRPVTMIVPWAPGGSTDILARTLSEQLSKTFSQPFLVENRPGASGNMGSNIVAKATSAASRPVPMRIRPVIGVRPVGSNNHQRSPIHASTYEWKSGGPSPCGAP